LDTRKLATSLIAVAAIVAGCSSSSVTPSPVVTPPAPTATATTAATAAATATPTPSVTASPAAGLTVDSFDATFSAMSQLKSIHDAGTGSVGVIMPDTTSSIRWNTFDTPYLKQAFEAAGYSASEFKIDNAQGSDATELSLAQADITNGAKVLIVASIDATVAAQVQTYAAAHGVALIAYDRAIFQGTTTYYVSFDGFKVGTTIGQGFMKCITDWNVKSPKVFELDGGKDTDPNAVAFAQGYNSIVWGTSATATGQVADGTTNSAGMTMVNNQFSPGWDNAKGGTIFQQAYTAHPEINATLEANDGLGNAVVTALKAKGVPPKTIPTTGQDATLQGMENVLQGYQCGSVYKPFYLEAQDAVAVATYVRAGQAPPASLINGTTTDPKTSMVEPASLLVPLWVDGANMEATVIKDKFISVSDLCTAVGQSVCTAAGIS
jgi:D-xylose transport system substrate-binding protein